MSERRRATGDLRRREQARSVISGLLCGLSTALALVPASVEAQSASAFDEVGRFYVRNFSPEDYDSHPVNWAVVQSLDGLVYVANGDGVLEYDGVSWRLISISNRNAARSLAVGGEGQVFVGGINQLGYLAPDSAGRMRFVSLVDHIAPEDRTFEDVWSIQRASGNLYFQAGKRLFRWDGLEMKVWRPETRFHLIFALGGQLYVQQLGIGLMRVDDDDSLAMVPSGAFFRDKRIYGLVPQSKTTYLVVTRKGMFECPRSRHGEAVCSPFRPDLTDLLVALQPYHVIVVREGVLAVATRRGGVVLLDRSGRLLRILNEASGLRNEEVSYAYADRQGGLWLGSTAGWPASSSAYRWPTGTRRWACSETSWTSYGIRAVSTWPRALASTP